MPIAGYDFVGAVRSLVRTVLMHLAMGIIVVGTILVLLVVWLKPYVFPDASFTQAYLVAMLFPGSAIAVLYSFIVIAWTHRKEKQTQAQRLPL